jgi:hypothetical protein
MPQKRTIIVAVSFLVLLVGLLFIMLAAVTFFLPEYLESRLIPSIAADVGLTDYEFDVRHVGLKGADLGIMRIGRDKAPALVIRSIQIDYTLKGLLQQRIRRAVLSGIELYAEYSKGQIRFRNFDLQALLAKMSSGPRSKAASKKSAAAVAIGQIDIRNAALMIEANNRTYRIPFESEIKPEDQHLTAFDISAHVYPRGQMLSTAMKLDLKAKNAALQFDVAELDLARFTDLTRLVPDLTLFGRMQINGSATLLYSPFELSAANLQLQLQGTNLSYAAIGLQNSRDADGRRVPIIFDANTDDGRIWEISSSALRLVSPLPLEIAGFKGIVSTMTDAIESKGAIAVRVSPFSTSGKPHLALAETLPLDAEYSASYESNGNWEFQLNDKSQKKADSSPAELIFEQYKISSKHPQIDLQLKGNNAHITASYSARLNDAKINSSAIAARIPATLLQGEAKVELGAKPTRQASFKLNSTAIGISAGHRKIDIPQLTFGGSIIQKEPTAIRATGLLRFSGTDLRDSELKSALDGIKGTVPLQWPPSGNVKAGKISVAGITYQNLALGSVSANIRQTTTGFDFSGNLVNRLIPELALKFSGNANLLSSQDPQAEIKFGFSRQDVLAEIALEKFAASATGLNLGGLFSLDGRLLLNTRGLTGWMDSRLADAKLSWPNYKVTIDGIQAEFSLPQLPTVRSAPQQTLTFKRASIGDIEVTNGAIDFQIESPQSLFIEKSRFKWCDGSVDTQAMRIKPQKDDYNLVLFCNRLNLAKVLGQFGAANAKGSGTVNGKIPLRYRHGVLSFDDGFLYSTPGEGGKILLKGTDILTAHFPQNTPEYDQMELARAALSDYDYNWAKLNINTEGEDLKIGLKLKGKPANKLPFVYKKDIGRFAKVEADVQGTEFPEINLDVNFRLPLNKILYYKDIINMIE